MDQIDLVPLIASSPGKNTRPPLNEAVLSGKEMILINMFWFSYQLFWFLLLIVIMPKHIEIIMGDSLVRINI
jgi:hypothetical protein